MWKAKLIGDSVPHTVIVQARSLPKLQRKIEEYSRTHKILLMEGESLVFPKNQRLLIDSSKNLPTATYRFLIRNWSDICRYGEITTTWELEEVI